MCEKECSCAQQEFQEEEGFSKARLRALVAGAGLLLLTWLLPVGRGEFICYLAAYILCGYDVLLRSLKNLSHGEVFDENFLMTLATLGAFAVGEYPEGVAVMLFYQIGEKLQDYAAGNSRRQIVNLTRLTPETARVVINGQETPVAPQAVQVGQVLRVRAGERIALDGKILSGSGFLDFAAITGESRPEVAAAGKHVPAGSISVDGVLDILVEKTYENSAIAQIIKLTEQATEKKSKTEKFITRFARIYTPIVVGIAVIVALLPPLVLPAQPFHDWIYRALIFLVISCPCALVLSVPLGFFGGIGGAARQGILIKGSSYLEQLSRIYMIAFDKTGTLTKGVFCVNQLLPQPPFDNTQLLQTAAALEAHSNHPLGKAITSYAQEHKIPLTPLSKVQEMAGEGMVSQTKADTLLAGNARLMERFHITPLPDVQGTCVYVTRNQTLVGVIVLGDQLKETAAQTVDALRNGLADKLALLSGDNRAGVLQVAQSLHITDAYGGLLPQDKVTLLEQFIRQSPRQKSVLFVGDGINDAPVLKRADVGVAMRHAGADIAVEAADIVLLGADPAKLVSAVRLSRKTLQVIRQNITFALGVKILVLGLGILGLASMWMAVFADVGVSLLAVLNALRPLYFKP